MCLLLLLFCMCLSSISFQEKNKRRRSFAESAGWFPSFFAVMELFRSAVITAIRSYHLPTSW